MGFYFALTARLNTLLDAAHLHFKTDVLTEPFSRLNYVVINRWLTSAWICMCLQGWVSCGGEQDIWGSTPEFAPRHHPGIWEQCGGMKFILQLFSHLSDSSCVYNHCIVLLCFHPRCWGSGRGCTEARISPVTSPKMDLCFHIILCCLRVGGTSSYKQLVLPNLERGLPHSWLSENDSQTFDISDSWLMSDFDTHVISNLQTSEANLIFTCSMCVFLCASPLTYILYFKFYFSETFVERHGRLLANAEWLYKCYNSSQPLMSIFSDDDHVGDCDESCICSVMQPCSPAVNVFRLVLY